MSCTQPDRTFPETKGAGSRWREDYHNKRLSAEEAASLVVSGDRVYLGGGSGIPSAFAAALGKRAPELKGVTIYQGLAMGLYEYMKPENRESFHIETMFVGPMERVCMEWGVAQYKPMHLSEIPEAGLRARCNRVAFVATPPDENGYMNRSCFGAFLPNREVLHNAETVIVEVNRETPWLNGDDFKIHVSQVDHIIENDSPLFELPEIPITDIERKIAPFVADLVPDGACIQIGIGGLANAIGHLLMDKKDLGMHAEMVTPAIRKLVEAGVVNGSRKNFCPNRVVAAFAIGTHELYRYLDRNEKFLFREIGWVNNPDTIGSNDNVVSINNALMVDLTGQAASESIGTRQYSGTGGQVDFVRGARKSRGGKSIIALESTYRDREGNIKSKILSSHPEGTVVSTSRNDVEYIVTEYGVANVRLESISNRVKALIGIAHPDFREKLRSEAKRNGWI